MRITRFAVVAGLLVAGSNWLVASSPVPEQPRRMFVSVTDTRGVPVAGLSAADFLIRVEGKDATVISADPAREPLSIIVVTEGFPRSLISDARNSLRAIVTAARAQHPESRVGLMLADGAAAPRMHPVSERAADLDREISRFFESSLNAPLLDSLLIAAQSLSAERGTRRVVIAISVGGEASGVIAPIRVAHALRDAGAALWTVEVGGAGRSLGSSEGRVLSEVTKSSGGRQDSSSLAALASNLKRVVEVIGAQYLVTFEPPVAGEVSTVGVFRPGLSVHAPAWASLKLTNR
jgi:hypothetical protein